MGRRVKNQKAAKLHHEDEIEGEECGGAPKLSKYVSIPDSSDDEEANEDLSLKIIEKARSRAIANNDAAAAASAALNGGGGDVSLHEVRNSDDMMKGSKKLRSEKKVKVVKKIKVVKKSKKKKKTETPTEFVDLTRDDEMDTVLNVENLEITKLVETRPIEIADNVVLKKLLRAPRYFEPQDSGWNSCYNCGEEGHKTVSCTSEKRRKPCFVCGSLEHNAKQCSKGHDCFICNKGGHRAKACPEKYKGKKFHDSQICLKCGGQGHDMFSCKTGYSADDLKEILCYICKSFGHLCCAGSVDPGPSVLSCYKCGEIGHNGLECGRSRGGSATAVVSCYKCGEGHLGRECQNSSIKESGRSRDESITTVSCYKCGEKGHFARECQSSSIKEYGRSHYESYPAGSCNNYDEGQLASEYQIPSLKAWKKNHESTTPARNVHKLNRDYNGNRSAPPNFGKPHKRKFSQYDEGYSTPSVSMNRGGWIPEHQQHHHHHHGDMPGRNGWISPATPTTFRKNYYDSAGNSSYTPNHYNNTHRYGNSTSNGSDRFYRHDYSALRFDNSGGSGDYRRNYR